MEIRPFCVLRFQNFQTYMKIRFKWSFVGGRSSVLLGDCGSRLSANSGAAVPARASDLGFG